MATHISMQITQTHALNIATFLLFQTKLFYITNSFFNCRMYRYKYIGCSTVKNNNIKFSIFFLMYKLLKLIF